MELEVWHFFAYDLKSVAARGDRNECIKSHVDSYI